VCDFFLKKISVLVYQMLQRTWTSSLPLKQRSSAFQHAVCFFCRFKKNLCTWTLSLPLLQRSAAFQRAVCLCVYGCVFVCVRARTCRRGRKRVFFFVPKRNKQRTRARACVYDTYDVCLRVCAFVCGQELRFTVNIVRNIEQGCSVENKRKKGERC
jgi:hypothetical protein